MTLAYEESAFELPDVTLAREDDRFGVLDQMEDASFSYSSHIGPNIYYFNLPLIGHSRLTIQIIIRDLTSLIFENICTCLNLP